MVSALVELDVEPFADEFLADPLPYHERLREAGSVVRLPSIGAWAMARYEQVRAALVDYETYSSAAGVGLANFHRERPWRTPSLLLETDPPEHDRARSAMTALFTSKAVEGLREGFAAQARTLIDALAMRGSIDAVADLAEAYPLKVFPDAVGLDPHERGRLLEYGQMVFNGFGPRNRLFAEAFANAAEVQEWILARCRREALSPDGFGAKVYAAVDAGTITEDEAGLLVRSLLSAGVDTTVHALGIAVHALAAHPDQWAMLRADPALARAAFDEAIRYGSPVQTFFRTTTRDIDVDGVVIPAREKVLLFLGAANRDPRRWEWPSRFDITRRTGGHVGFGMGVHGCLGMAVARMQGEILLGELARRVSTVELAGAPVWRLNNTLRGYGRLPVYLTPAADHSSR